jgi:molybdopterin-containing oxidoreductase family membrane subunit
MKVEQIPVPSLQELIVPLERTKKSGVVFIAILVALISLGLFALYTQIAEGHIVTGMRDNVVWGIYIVNFIFFMGVSYAGALISGSLQLFRVKWRGPVMRFAELITIISLVLGPLYILLCIGRLDRLPYLFIYPRIQSPITWDVIAITTDFVGCAIFLWLAFLRDFAKLRDHASFKVAKWRKKMYNFLALGYTGTPEQEKKLLLTKDIMAAMIIAIAIIVYSVLAWIFSITLQPGWDSTIFGPYFVIAAVYSGAGVLIIVMRIYRKVYRLEKYITMKHFVGVGIIMMVLALFFAYFTFSEYLDRWYGQKTSDSELLHRLFDQYFWTFLFANYLSILAPIIVMGIPKFRTINSITIVAIISVVGLWLNRYLIVVPTLETPFLPIQDTREAWIHYSGTWVEWVLTLGGIASFCLFFTLATKLVPSLDVSEMEHIAHTEAENKKNLALEQAGETV